MVPRVTLAEVRSAFPRVNQQKATGPDRYPDLVHRTCMDLLAEVFANKFKHFLLQLKVLTYFQETTIIPMPNKIKGNVP